MYAAYRHCIRLLRSGTFGPAGKIPGAGVVDDGRGDNQRWVMKRGRNNRHHSFTLYKVPSWSNGYPRRSRIKLRVSTGVPRYRKTVQLPLVTLMIGDLRAKMGGTSIMTMKGREALRAIVSGQWNRSDGRAVRPGRTRCDSENPCRIEPGGSPAVRWWGGSGKCGEIAKTTDGPGRRLPINSRAGRRTDNRTLSPIGRRNSRGTATDRTAASYLRRPT